MEHLSGVGRIRAPLRVALVSYEAESRVSVLGEELQCADRSQDVKNVEPRKRGDRSSALLLRDQHESVVAVAIGFAVGRDDGRSGVFATEPVSATSRLKVRFGPLRSGEMR